MDQFYSLLCNCWKGDGDVDSMDIIFNLPPEMAIVILRMLDPRALVAAVLVCKRWFRLIRSDRVLRKTVREELVRQREARMNLYYGVDTVRPSRRARHDGSAVRNAFVRKNMNKVAHGNTVSAPAAPQPASVPMMAPRARQFACEVFNIPTEAPQLRVPRKTYNMSSGVGFDPRKVKTVYPARTLPEASYSFAPQLDAPGRKASKYRPSKKIVENCKSRPASLRL